MKAAGFRAAAPAAPPEAAPSEAAPGGGAPGGGAQLFNLKHQRPETRLHTHSEWVTRLL